MNHNRNETIPITIHNPEGRSRHTIITPLSHIYENKIYLPELLLFYLIPCFVTSHEIFLLAAAASIQLVFVFMFYLIATIIVTMLYSLDRFFFLYLQPLFTFVPFCFHTSFLSINLSLMVHSTCAIIKLSIDGSFFRLVHFFFFAVVHLSLPHCAFLLKHFMCPYLIFVIVLDQLLCVACRYRFAGSLFFVCFPSCFFLSFFYSLKFPISQNIPTALYWWCWSQPTK